MLRSNITSESNYDLIKLYLGSAEIFIAEIVLIIRLWAIYGKSRLVLFGMSALLILTASASVAIAAVQNKNSAGRWHPCCHSMTCSLTKCISFSGTNEPIPGLFLCLVTSPVGIYYAYWLVLVLESLNEICNSLPRRIPTVVFESAAFTLAAYKTVQHVKEAGGGQHTLMILIFRDSSAYFVV